MEEFSNLVDSKRPMNELGVPKDIHDDGTYPYKDAIYTDSTVIYSPIPEQMVNYVDVPPEFGRAMTEIFNEAAMQEDNPYEVKDKETLDSLNAMFDMDSKEKRTTDVMNVATAMAERNVPVSNVIDWYNKEMFKITSAGPNSGVFSELADARIAGMAEENPPIAACMIDQTRDHELLDGMITSYQNTVVNINAFNTKVMEANNDFDSQGILTQTGKGLATGSVWFPFVDNKTAFQLSGSLKEVFGDDFERTANANTLFENAKKKIYEAQQSLPPAEFKTLIDKVDEKLLNGGWLSLGDRRWFWNNLYNQEFVMNRAVLAGEFAGVGFATKAAAKTIKLASPIAKAAGASKMALSTAAAMTTMQEVIPGSGIAALAVGKALKLPLKTLALVGKRKNAAALAALDFAKADRVSALRATKEFNAAAKSALESVGSGLSKPIIGDAAIDITKTSPLVQTQAILSSPTAKELGLQRTVELFKKLKTAGFNGQILRETKNEAEQRFINDVIKNMDKKKAFIQSVSSKDSKEGFTTVLELGVNNSNEGFHSAKDADTFAKSLNIISDDYLGFKVKTTKPKVVHRADGYFVQVERSYGDISNMPIGLGKMANVKVTEPFPEDARKAFDSGWFGKLSTNLTIPHLERTLNMSFQMAEGETRTALQDVLRSISKGKGAELNRLLEITNSTGEWIKSSALARKGVSEKTIKAYESYRTLEDLSRMFDGANLLRDFEELGVKNIYSGGARVGLGSVVTDYDAKTVYRLSGYDEVSGEWQLARVDNTKQMKKDFTVFKMQTPLNGEAKYLAVDNKMLAQSEPTWSDTFLSYRPGRMNFSVGSGFVKQVRIGRGQDGEKWIDGVSTVFSHPNQKSVKDVTDTLEQARQLAIKVNNQELTLGEAERLFEKLPHREHLRYANFEKFYDLCGKDGIISLDPESVLQYVPDGQNLSSVAGLDVSEYNRRGISMLEMSHSESAIRRKLRTDSDILNPFTLENAPRVSLEEELGMQVENIVRATSVEDYTKMYAEDFKNTFGQYLTDKKMDPVQFLLHENLEGIIKDKEALNMAKHARETYQLVRGMPSSTDKLANAVFGDLANKMIPGWVAPEGSNMLSLYKNFSKFNPFQKARSFNFHYLLGLWNPRQLYVQALASFNVGLLSPKASGQVAPLLPVLMSYAVSGEKSILTKAAKKLGVKTSYLEDLAEGAKELDIWSKGSFGGAFDVAERGKIWNNMSSTFFYDKGEFINRFFSAAVTQQELLNKGIKGGIRGMTTAEKMQALVRQQNLYINMGRAGTSQVQRGFPGLITQFQGYPMRSLELLMDHTLTKTERGQFLVGQLLFGGTKGAFGRASGAMIHSMLQGGGMPDSFNDALYNGVLDTLLKENGGKISLAEFFSPQMFDMFDLALHPMEEIPAMQTGTRVVTGLQGVAASLRAYGRGEEFSRDSWTAFANTIQDAARKGVLPTSLNKAILGYMVYKSGMQLKANGVISQKDLTSMDAALIALGFKSPRSDMEYLTKYKTMDRRQKVQEIISTADELFNMQYKAPTQEQRDMYARLLHNVLSQAILDDADIGETARTEFFQKLKHINLGETSLEHNLKSLVKTTKYRDTWSVDKLKEELNGNK